MRTQSLEQVQAHLPEIIERLATDGEVIITRDNRPVARLVSETTARQTPRQAGTCKGMILGIADDFDGPLEDFQEYME